MKFTILFVCLYMCLCVYVFVHVYACSFTGYMFIFLDFLLHDKNNGINNSGQRLLSKNFILYVTSLCMHTSTKCKMSKCKSSFEHVLLLIHSLAAVVNPSPNFDANDGEAKCKNYTGCSMCWLFDQEKNGQVIDYVTKRYGVLTYVR